MNESEQKLLRRMILGSALNSIQESGRAILNNNLKDELPCGMTAITREIKRIESYVANYERYKPYLSIIDDYLNLKEHGCGKKGGEQNIPEEVIK